tara:strand:+ start:258 stop:749 length:492 start_codon:yes stop_codon:yes gene_type:complete
MSVGLLKSIKVVVSIVLFSLAGIGILILLSHFSLLGGYDVKIVLSGSMQPVISTGSLVFTGPSHAYDVGDVVMFKRHIDDVPTTHRIVAQEGDSFVTKGDGNDAEDILPVYRDDIQGKMLFHIPFLGYLFAFLKTRLGMGLLIGVPAIWIIVEEIVLLQKKDE